MLRKILTIASFAAAGAVIAAAVAHGITDYLASPALADAERNMTVIHKTSTAPWPTAPTRADLEEACIIGLCQDI
ncbi:hypothetical protein [Thermopetrobacter sp. TC1]|uniref:hypothetical protein n=1 Tax=Thermopetrobacter sp. TC1 TaxID=1495045 RepID=UPI000571585D|nr:hypothetical protein [Thermopetrobacter sp. TC1]